MQEIREYLQKLRLLKIDDRLVIRLMLIFTTIIYLISGWFTISYFLYNKEAKEKFAGYKTQVIEQGTLVPFRDGMEDQGPYLYAMYSPDQRISAESLKKVMWNKEIPFQIQGVLVETGTRAEDILHNKFTITTFPSYVLTDKNGLIVHRWVGDLDYQNMIDVVAKTGIWK